MFAWKTTDKEGHQNIDSAKIRAQMRLCDEIDSSFVSDLKEKFEIN
ncbi:MAG: hypothetical protein HUK24_03920 [Sphaerochaetaceae bacterium]|nr:hypothetical protein [Sphaerochaetaceae bacterium]